MIYYDLYVSGKLNVRRLDKPAAGINILTEVIFLQKPQFREGKQ